MSMTKTLCRDVRKGVFSQAFAGVAAGAVGEAVFPKAVNRVIITGELGVPFSWSVSEAGTAVDPPTVATLAGGMQTGSGVVTIGSGLSAVIEFQHGVRSFKFRNLGAATPSNPTIEGHIVGADS
jgi:hypothetical protein